jgi:prolyl oligopeptidase
MKQTQSYINTLILISLFIFTVYHDRSKITYPKTRKVDVVDTYHGVSVEDPYRWLEDDQSMQTNRWVKAQNRITEKFLRKIPFRKKIKNRLTELNDYEKWGTPFQEGNKFYFYKNDGLQNQWVLYRQDNLNTEPEIVLNPNTFSEDGTVALRGTYFSNDSRYLGYGVSSSGSDWKEFYVLDLNTHQLLNDHIQWIKFSGMAWTENGFYYSTFPKPDEGDELSGTNENSKVFYHELGTDQNTDILIFADPENPRHSPYVSTTEDNQFLILYQTKGTHGNTVAIQDLNNPDSPFISVVSDFDGEHGIIHNNGNTFYMMTDRNSPKKRLVSFTLNNSDISHWIDILPESEHTLQSVSFAGDKLIAIYMVDAQDKAFVHTQNGEFIQDVELPAPGSLGGFGGKKYSKEVFYSFETFNQPRTIYRFDLTSLTSETYQTSGVTFSPEEYVTSQSFYPSKDGTQIPLFITHKKDIELDNSNPTLLYAYGGFNISMQPFFSTGNIVLLENGGVYALACLRGGGEYGDAWHKGGMLENKQNVFDDFIAGAEYLIHSGYTSPEKLAVRGGSNGGLLIGAVINQRPELFKVAFPAVGVMDMLRYHQFTIGWAWAVEFGSSDDPEHFQNLYSYSPLHNINSEAIYPATMVTTADHDDRVVPAHSFKYTAALQEKRGDNPNPLLIRIETKAGHGAGKPITKYIEEQADIWSFMFYNMDEEIDY